MHKAIVAALALGAALFVSPALAQERASEPSAPTLTVSAEGSVRAPPDIATLSLGVTTFNADASAAMAANAERMAALTQALRRAGVAQRDIQTSRLNLQPRERGGRSNNYEEPVIVGYSASHQMRVQTRDLDGLPRLITAAIAAGGNTLQGVRFSLDEPQAQLDAARREAVAEARRRAELYADAAGLRVMRILRMSEGYNRVSGNDDEIIVTGYRANDVGAMPDTPVEIGQIQTRSVMTVVFELR